MKMKMTMMDEGGRESRTLSFVSVAFWVITIKYVLSNLDLHFFGAQAPVSMTEYASSFALIIGVWIGREWVKKPLPDAQ
jgi:hypothetical protein